MPYKNKEDKTQHNRKYFRVWYQKNGRQRNRAANYVETIMNWQRNNPGKVKVTRVVNRAIKAGRIFRPQKCSCCGRERVRIVGHHKDYLAPFDIIWLCVSCHKLLHAELVT